MWSSGVETRSSSRRESNTCLFEVGTFRCAVDKRSCWRDTRLYHRSTENHRGRLVLGGLGCKWVDADPEPLLVLVLEFHMAIDRGEQRVVRGATHVPAGMELGAALNDDDRPGPHEFPTETLHAQVLRIRIAPVARRADAFFMSHAILSRLSRRRS